MICLKNHAFRFLPFLFFLFWSCDSGPVKTPNQKNPDRSLIIGFIPKSNQSHYWKSVYAGAQEAAEAYKVKLIWQAPYNEGNVLSQSFPLYDLLDIPVDAIVLAPINATELTTPAQAVINEKVPLVVIDSEVANTKFSSFIGSNNYELGQISAEHMGKLVRRKGKILMLPYQKGNISTQQREQGFRETMAKKYPHLKVVTSGTYAGFELEKAQQISLAFLNQHPDAAGIFTPAETATQSMLQALKTKNLHGKVIFIGTDVNDSISAGLKQGYIQGIGLQDPHAMGYLGVKTAVAAARKQKISKKLLTKAHFITPENLNDPELQHLLKQ